MTQTSPAGGSDERSSEGRAGRREFLGQIVREEWIAWAKEQPSPKASWLQQWQELTEPEREVDRRIGERVYSLALDALYEPLVPVSRLTAAQSELEGLRAKVAVATELYFRVKHGNTESRDLDAIWFEEQWDALTGQSGAGDLCQTRDMHDPQGDLCALPKGHTGFHSWGGW